MSVYNEADERILPLALRERGGFHVATDWYLRGAGQSRGWLPLGYQYAWHHAPQKSTTGLMGIAAGKTTMGSASMLIDCLSIPYFRALATSVTAAQAELTFDMFLAWYELSPNLKHLVTDISLRPFPQATFLNHSTWEWRTAGIDARYIRGFEYDRILYDEAGLDYAGMITSVLRGRLRGRRVDGSERMARLDVITSPTDVPWLRERFEKGDPNSPNFDPRRYLSMRIETFQNTHLTPEQVDAIVADYSEDMIDVELRAMFPDYGLSLFPSSHVHACVDPSLYDVIIEALRGSQDGTRGPKPGYVLEEDPRHGIAHYEIPPSPSGVYVVVGDPGTDNFPKRNAAAVGVLRLDRGEKELVYFKWVNGRGSYIPFLQAYKYAMDKYHTHLSGIDATGTQKAIDELAFEQHGIAVNAINFGREKDAMLNALSLDITNHRLRYPPIRGLVSQLAKYSRDLDKKIPQDITMMMAMGSWLARFVQPDASPYTVDRNVAQANYLNRQNRTSSSRRR